MEKKNTVLLTVIAVATLLVAVVGATFAYFTAANSTTGDAAGNVNVNTATEGASLQLNVNKVTGSNNVFYPGTKNFVGATASAQFVDNNAPSDNKEYNVSYTLTGKVTLAESFVTPIEWELYETETDLSSGLITCGAITQYTPDATDEEPNPTTVEGSKTQSCTLSSSLANDASKKVKSGIIATGETTATITHNGTVRTNGATVGATKYYYLVVTLPENGTNQNADATGKTITIAIDKIEQTGAAVAAS